MLNRRKTRPAARETKETKDPGDFRLRSSVTGYEGYRPADYRLYYKLEESWMLPRLDEHLEKLLSGEVDDGNGDMLDTLIFSAAREALPDLERQRLDHGDTMRRLAARREADRKDLRQIREQCGQELAALEADYKEIRLKMKKCGEEVV